MDDVEFDPGKVGIASTDPTLPAHHALPAPVRAPQSTPGRGYDREDADVAPMSQVQLRTHVFDEIRARMVRAAVPNMSMISQSFLSFLLPLKNASKAMWEELLTKPFLLPDTDLEEMFNLRKCTVRDQHTWEVGHVILYIRSFSFKVHQFTAVLDHLKSNGVWIGKDEHWRDTFEKLSPGTTIFLRYCGCTGSSAWQRHHEDVFGTRQKSQFLQILQTTKLLYPEIIDDINIYDLVTGTIPFSLPRSNEVRDLREQALVALFGMKTLLNTQVGGRFPSIDISPELEQEYLSLRLSTLTRLLKQTSPCQASVVQDIKGCLKGTQQYANEHPDSTGTDTFSFTDKRCEALLPQYTPRTLRGTSYTPMALASIDPGVLDFKAGLAFYEGESFFREMICTILRFLCRTESQDYQVLPTKLVSQGYLPLFDLFPWCRRSPEDLPEVMAESRRYLQAINPLVLVTFGHQVSSVAKGNFTHDHGLKSGDLSSVAGQPSIVYYCDHNAPEEVREKSCVIVVPCYHPGAGLYNNSLGPEFNEVMVRTMIAAWTVLFFALKIPKTGLKKCDLLKLIVKAANDSIGGTSPFATNLTAARDRLRASRKAGVRPHPRTSSKSVAPKGPRGVPSTHIKDSDRIWGASVERRPFERRNLGSANNPSDLASAERWDAASQEMNMIMLCGWASYPPGSFEANLQCRTLVSKDIATLMTDRTGNSRGSLLKWACTVKQGQYFYLEAADIADEALDVPNLLAIFAAQSVNIEDAAWVEDEEELEAASKKLRAWLYEKVKQPSTTLKTATARGREALTGLMFMKDPDIAAIQTALLQRKFKQQPKIYADPTQSLEGCEVDILPRDYSPKTPSALLNLHWADNSGRMWQLSTHKGDETRITLPPRCMSVYRSDRRHIHFVAEGIDIRTSDGLTLKTDTLPCTLPLAHIRLMLKGEIRAKFLELWSRETGLDAESTEHNVQPQTGDPSSSTLTGQYYPAEAFRPLSGSRENQDLNVGISGRIINQKKEESRVQSYLPLQAGDAIWLLHKFLQEQYPGVCKLDVGNPNIIPGTDSMWVRLQTFLDTPKYAQHPKKQHLKDIAATALLPMNTGGCDQMLKVALEKFLRPGTTSKRFRVYVAPKQKWKIVFDLSANPPSLKTLPPSVNPQLRHDTIMEIAENDTIVDQDGELVDTEPEAEDDQIVGGPEREQVSQFGNPRQPTSEDESTAVSDTSLEGNIPRSRPLADILRSYGSPPSVHGTVRSSSSSSLDLPEQPVQEQDSQDSQDSSGGGTIQVARTSSPFAMEEVPAKRKRAARADDDDDSGEGSDRDGNKGKRQRC